MTVPKTRRPELTPSEEAEVVPETGRRRPSRRLWLILGLLALALLVFLFVRRGHQATTPAVGAAQNRVVPVGAAPAQQRDIPIWVEGLGNVTSLANVTVRSRVDGQLVSINFQEGSRVKKGELLVQLDPRPYRIALQSAQATLQKDEATLKYAKLDLQRYTDLRAGSLIAQQQVDTQRSLVDQLTATVALDRAAVDNAKLNLLYSSITSPIDGIAGVRQVDLGNQIHATDTTGIVVLTQMDPIAVLFTLPQDDLSRVSEAFSKGQPLTVEAWDRGGLVKLGVGKLTVIDNQINAATATMRLKAEFPNPDLKLWPSQFVKARLLLQTRTGATVVPTPAIQRGPNGTFVYVVNPDNTVAVRPVQVDTIQGPLALLTQGIKPGERVVTDGQNQLRPGAKVDPRMAPASGQQQAQQPKAQDPSGQ